MKKVRFLIGIPRIPQFRCNFSSPAAKKRKPNDSTVLRTFGVEVEKTMENHLVDTTEKT